MIVSDGSNVKRRYVLQVVKYITTLIFVIKGIRQLTIY